jgi:hypothetical protein
MLVAVVVVFAVTWTPFHVFNILLEFRRDILPGRYIKLIDLMCHVVAFSSACVNPFLYGWMNDNYRTSFLTLIAPLRRKRRPTAATSKGAADAADWRRAGSNARLLAGEASAGVPRCKVIVEAPSSNAERMSLVIGRSAVSFADSRVDGDNNDNSVAVDDREKTAMNCGRNEGTGDIALTPITSVCVRQPLPATVPLHLQQQQ